MAIGFGDRVMAQLATPAGRAQFVTAIGLAAYAGVAFGRRYGQGGFTVDGVTLADATACALQWPLVEDVRISGSRQWQGRPDRQSLSYRVHQGRAVGWVDAVLTLPATFALEAVPGSVTLGPGTAATSVAPVTGGLAVRLPVTTGAFTLQYSLRAHVFAADAPAPTTDLRRIRTVRRHLEADPSFLATLDGPAGQHPHLFVQVYPPAAAGSQPAAGDLSEAAIAALFDAADVLAATFAVG